MFENDAIKLSSFVEGQTRSLKLYSFLNGVIAPRRHATNGWIIVIGNQGAPRDCDKRASPMLCTAYVSAMCSILRLLLFLCGKRTIFVLRRCTGRLGLAAFLELVLSFDSFPFPSLFLRSRR